MTAPQRKLKALDQDKPNLTGAPTYADIMEWERHTGAIFEEFNGPNSLVPVVDGNGALIREEDGSPFMRPRPTPFEHRAYLMFLIERKSRPGLTFEDFCAEEMSPGEEPKPDPPEGSG